MRPRSSCRPGSSRNGKRMPLSVQQHTPCVEGRPKLRSESVQSLKTSHEQEALAVLLHWPRCYSLTLGAAHARKDERCLHPPQRSRARSPGPSPSSVNVAPAHGPPPPLTLSRSRPRPYPTP